MFVRVILLSSGQTVDCVVESLNESAHTAVLRAQRKAVVEAIARGGNLAFTSIVPGMMLNVTVDKIVEVQTYSSCYEVI